MDTTEKLSKIYEDVKSWLVYNETKNGVLLGILGIIFKYLLEHSLELIKKFGSISIYIFIISTFLGILIIFFSFIPFILLKIKIKGIPSDNLIFYKDLSFYENISDLEDKLKLKLGNTTNFDNLEKSYINQLFHTSKIAYNKSRFFIFTVYPVSIFYFISIILGLFYQIHTKLPVDSSINSTLIIFNF